MDVSTILESQLYLSDLPAAQSPNLREKFGITHILTVCPDFPSAGPNHLALGVADLEYENLLIQFPAACRFIESALENKANRVLVHCSLGISRSATVVCAYIMKTYKWETIAAIDFVKQRRPKIFPNSGFRKQLDVFAACNYDPTPSTPAYLNWKAAREQDITDFMRSVVEMITIIPDQLFLNTKFRNTADDCQVFSQLLLDFGLCHILSVTPSQLSPDGLPAAKYRHVNVSDRKDDTLLSVLPGACEFIHDTLSAESDCKGRVLLHCESETRAYTIVCAYLIFSRRVSPQEAFSTLKRHPAHDDVMRALEAFHYSLAQPSHKFSPKKR